MTVWYTAYETKAALLRAYRDEVGRQYGQGGKCPRNGGEGTYSIEARRGSAGRVACFEEGGIAWLAWTEDTTRIFAVASQHPPRWKSFWTWWRSEAGPYPPS
jgi:hypothetical protein